MINGPLSTRHGASLGCGWRKDLQYGELLRIYIKKKHNQGQPTRFSPPAWGLGEVLTNPYLQNDLATKRIPVFWTWTDTLLRPNPWKSDMRSGIWKVRSLYKSGSLTIVARELAKYKLHLVGL